MCKLLRKRILLLYYMWFLILYRTWTPSINECAYFLTIGCLFFSNFIQLTIVWKEARWPVISFLRLVLWDLTKLYFHWEIHSARTSLSHCIKMFNGSISNGIYYTLNNTLWHTFDMYMITYSSFCVLSVRTLYFGIGFTIYSVYKHIGNHVTYKAVLSPYSVMYAIFAIKR